MMRKVLLLTVLMACTTADPISQTAIPTPTPPEPTPLPAPTPLPETTAAVTVTPPTRPTTRPASPPSPVQPTPVSSSAPTPASTLTNQPDILVLGDSQISFGAGREYLNFFRDLPQRCGANAEQTAQLAALGQRDTAAIGVRSTALASWIARDGNAKGTICDVDERFGVNAGSYGIQGNDNLSFIQIGQGDDYQFCEPEKSPFEAAFAPGNYDPKLLILTFLGNAEDRWADNPSAAAQDVRNTLSQIPSDIPCVFLTSVPVFEQDTNDRRMQAQTNIINAFENAGGHCEPVAGFTPATRAAIEGQLEFFRQRDDGTLADPFHPRPAATRMFLDLNAPQLCDAVFTALGNP